MMNLLDQKIEDYTTSETNSSSTGIVFECDELDKYDFPDDVNLPEGEYYSIVVGLQEYKDRYNKQYVDVCYKVFNTKLKILWEREKLIGYGITIFDRESLEVVMMREDSVMP